MAAPLAIPIVARVVLVGVVAGTVAAVGWMINEIRKDDENNVSGGFGNAVKENALPRTRMTCRLPRSDR